MVLLAKPVSQGQGCLEKQKGKSRETLPSFLENLEKVLTTTSCCDFCLGLTAAHELQPGLCGLCYQNISFFHCKLH